MPPKSPFTPAEFERMKEADKEAFIRIDKMGSRIDLLAQDILNTVREMGQVKVSIMENKIDDILSSDEIKKKIGQMASKSGRNTAFKWLAGIIPLIEVIRKILEVLWAG